LCNGNTAVSPRGRRYLLKSQEDNIMRNRRWMLLKKGRGKETA
jgi:hypothetical protein